MADALDLGSGSAEKKPNYLLYGGVLIVLVGGLFLLNRYKSSSSSTSGTAAGTSVGGTVVGSSPPVQDTTTEYVYNIKNVGNTTTTETTAPTNTSSAGGSASGSVPVSTGGSASGSVPVSTGGSSSGSSGSSSNIGTNSSGGNSGSSPPVTTPPVNTSGSSAISAISGYTDTGVAVLNQNASSSAKLAQLASSQATSIPGLSSKTVAYDKSLARSGAITGTTDTNVIQLNKADSFSQAQSILDSQQGVSIPGVSSAEVAYLQNKARHGQLTPQLYQSAIGG